MYPDLDFVFCGICRRLGFNFVVWQNWFHRLEKRKSSEKGESLCQTALFSRWWQIGFIIFLCLDFQGRHSVRKTWSVLWSGLRISRWRRDWCKNYKEMSYNKHKIISARCTSSSWGWNEKNRAAGRSSSSASTETRRKGLQLGCGPSILHQKQREWGNERESKRKSWWKIDFPIFIVPFIKAALHAFQRWPLRCRGMALGGGSGALSPTAQRGWVARSLSLSAAGCACAIQMEWLRNATAAAAAFVNALSLQRQSADVPRWRCLLPWYCQQQQQCGCTAQLLQVKWRRMHC